ncbi:hypothetical protein [Rubrobacter indicoceani]|uniref:hypothetical protein n=1 Tax=Rubrobacter indicoceani TaxID=2051957 RepID=UPI000E5B11BF|nr:hypothetical protein [Rubrobacter indicoceani]
MKVLCVGDLFLSAKEFGGDGSPEVREVMWAGERAEDQHRLQQIMEVDGPEAVPTPNGSPKPTGRTSPLLTP